MEQNVTSALALDAGRLFSAVEVAKLSPNGGILMPPGIRDVIIEIGCSDRNTMDDETLPNRPHSFLIAFEPLIDKYASLLAKVRLRRPGTSSCR